MSDDETPQSDETAPDAAPADDTTAAGDADATLPETPGAAPGADTSTVTEARSGVFVPRWVAFLVGGLIVFLLVGGAGFALGRATDGDDDDHPGVEAPRLPHRPGGPGGQGGPNGGGTPFPVPDGRSGRGDGGGGGGNGGDTLPSRGVLLGVAVESATGDTQGARVVQVVPDSPAAGAGIESGDVITKVDGTDIQTAADVVDAIGAHGSGDEITITYERDGESTTVDVTLGDIGGSGSGSSGSGGSSSSTS